MRTAPQNQPRPSKATSSRPVRPAPAIPAAPLPTELGAAADPAIAASGHDFRRISIEPPAAELAVSQPGDATEREADRLADRALADPAPRPSGAPAMALPRSRSVFPSPGQSLDSSTRAFLEPRLGWDLGAVRVHTDADAARSATALDAAAFTVGSDIAFAPHRYAPATPRGRALLAHEVAHVVQSSAPSAGPGILARQTVETYETKGLAVDPAKVRLLADRGYWQLKISSVLQLGSDPATTARFQQDPEERDAVLSVVWQIRPTTAVTRDVEQLVTVPKRAARTSQSLLYQITFRRGAAGAQDIVEVRFVSAGPGTAPVVPEVPSTSFRRSVAYSSSGFPGAPDAYWKAHSEQERRVFHWIETQAPAPKFDQILTIPAGSGSSSPAASFEVGGDKAPSGKLSNVTVIYLGATAATQKAATTGYGSHDFAEEGIEELQTLGDPVRHEKLGTLKGIDRLAPAERAAVRYSIGQYFRGGTRNAEVDAIVPLDATAARPRRAFYTFRFAPTTNEVDIQKIGEEGKDASLTPQGELAGVKGFQDHTQGTTDADQVKALKGWLKTRYPGVSPAGATVADIEKDVTAKIRADSGGPLWFEKNYGIQILDKREAEARLKKIGHGDPAELQGLSAFTPADLQLLETILEKMSDPLVKTFKGLQMIRQKSFFEPVIGSKPLQFNERKDIGGITVQSSTNRTSLIFDAASANVDTLFLGGLGPGGKAVVESHTGLAVTHELGHTIASLPGVQKAFDALVKGSPPPITWVAGQDPPKELLPEAFALYYSDPEWLKTKWLDLYNFFDALDTTGKVPKP
jgi:hypothetical protein